VAARPMMKGKEGKPDMTRQCRIGTSGWVYEHWEGRFYPQGLSQDEWLGFYQDHFETVEINNSFYRLPSESAFDQWCERAREGFRYALKANRYITHMKKLKDPADPVALFLKRARRLKEHLGPVLWQLPPRWHANPDRLEAFAQVLPDDLTHVFEFRDPDWFQDPIREILERHGLSFCIFSMTGLDCPKWVTSNVVYLRFHGIDGQYQGKYGEQQLAPWAERIRDWLLEGREVFAYFNNDAQGCAITDAQQLMELLE
jgi:uncharacterized protein YecE (DUF72 family)